MSRHTRHDTIHRPAGRLAAAAALAASVAVLAGCTTLLAPARVPAGPVPAPGTVPLTTTAPDPATPAPTVAPPGDDAAQRRRLAQVVHDHAVRFGVPAEVQAVRTTWLSAQDFLAADGAEPSGDTPVWVVQVRGGFTCDDCPTTQSGPERTVDTLSLVVDATQLGVLWQALGDAQRPLANLGEVVTLDPDGATGLLELERAVVEAAGHFGIPVKGYAVRTTWLAAQEFLPADGTEPAGDTPVWVAEVEGSFTCEACQPTQSGPEKSVRVLTLVLDAADYRVHYAQAGDVTRPLDNLGVGQALDLSPRA